MYVLTILTLCYFRKEVVLFMHLNILKYKNSIDIIHLVRFYLIITENKNSTFIHVCFWNKISAGLNTQILCSLEQPSYLLYRFQQRTKRKSSHWNQPNLRILCWANHRTLFLAMQADTCFALTGGVPHAVPHAFPHGTLWLALLSTAMQASSAFSLVTHFPGLWRHSCRRPSSVKSKRRSVVIQNRFENFYF